MNTLTTLGTTLTKLGTKLNHDGDHLKLTLNFGNHVSETNLTTLNHVGHTFCLERSATPACFASTSSLSLTILLDTK